jgi:hypothetical protein
VSSYTLYFLRPLDAKPTQHVNATQQPVQVPLSTNKRKATPDAPLSSTKRSKVSQQHFDSLPVETLLQQMNEAIDNSLWERRHQLIGASIALHAIKEAAKDPTIQTVALNGGVSRSEIMAWVEQSPKYSNWVSQMLLKMEPRSYQAAITKCLLKAGFSRTSSSGRYIKWYLPKDTTIVVSNVNKSENTTAVGNTNSNSKQKSQMQKQHRQQQQNKGSEGIQDRHGNEDGEEQDDEEEEEEEDEEGSDNEEDEKSGANDDLDHENEQENDDDNEDQDLDDQDVQGNDNSHYDDIEEGDDHPLRKSNLHEDDNDDKSSSSELDRTRPYSSSSPHHHRSRDTAHNKDDDEDDDDDDNDDEEEQDEEEGGREDEHDNYV